MNRLARLAVISGVTFGGAFIAGFFWNAVGVALSIYSQGTTMVALFAGVFGVVFFGPIWHFLGDRPISAAIFAGTVCEAVSVSLRAAAGGWWLTRLPLLSTIFDLAMPFMIGVSSMMVYNICFRILEMSPRSPGGAPSPRPVD